MNDDKKGSWKKDRVVMKRIHQTRNRCRCGQCRVCAAFRRQAQRVLGYRLYKKVGTYVLTRHLRAVAELFAMGDPKEGIRL